jgi:hypothetical protein
MVRGLTDGGGFFCPFPLGHLFSGVSINPQDPRYTRQPVFGADGEACAA